MAEKSLNEEAEEIRQELALLERARRTRMDLRDEAIGVLNRLHHLGDPDDYCELLTLAERKVFGAAEEVLRELIRRLAVQG